MSARLLADENIDDETCGFLRGMGHSVTHVRGMKGHPRDKGPDDEDILDCAAADQRAVVTDNVKHFKTLHDQGKRHFGIIGCPAHVDPKRKTEAISNVTGRCFASSSACASSLANCDADAGVRTDMRPLSRYHVSCANTPTSRRSRT